MNWAGLFCPCQANVWLGSQSHSQTLHMEYIRATRGKPSRGTSLCKPFSLQEILAFVWHCWMRWQFLHLKNRQCQVLQIQRFKWQTWLVQYNLQTPVYALPPVTLWCRMQPSLSQFSKGQMSVWYRMSTKSGWFFQTQNDLVRVQSLGTGTRWHVNFCMC